MSTIERNSRKVASRGKATAASKSKGTKAGGKITKGLEEALAMVRSGEPVTARRITIEMTPREYTPELVRKVRGTLGASQVVFAQFLGVDANTVRSWEQGTRPPSGMARRFLDEIAESPAHWKKRLKAMVARHTVRDDVKIDPGTGETVER